jgi:hypothetical protein
MFASRKALSFCGIAVALGAALTLSSATLAAPQPGPTPPAQLEVAKIFWEYNSTDDDLGVQVSLDGEEWQRLKIVNPVGKTIFSVVGRGPYKQLGLSELFFEGAEPTLTEFPLQDLLDLFPEGQYDFKGATVDGGKIEGAAMFTHAIPAGTVVSTEQGPGDLLRLHWTAVTGNPPGFPVEPIAISGYQVIVEPFQVTVPANVFSVTVPPEFVASLEPGTHDFEVLAIDASANQTITSGAFVK